MRTRRRKKVMSEINVVPYIDVMLVLLVIFMITAPLLSQGVNVELPKVDSKQMPPTDNEPVVLSVNAAGQFFSSYPTEDNDKPRDAEFLVNHIAAVKKLNPKKPIYLKGDRRVDYGKVMELMALLQRAGVEGVGLVTTPPGT